MRTLTYLGVIQLGSMCLEDSGNVFMGRAGVYLLGVWLDVVVVVVVGGVREAVCPADRADSAEQESARHQTPVSATKQLS